MNSIEANHREQSNRVTAYYDVSQKYYERVWYWGNKGLGLHYGFWEPGVRNRNDAIEKENEVLSDLAGIIEKDLVLDAGCGVAGSGIWLAKNTGASVVGINITASQLLKGQRLVQKNNVEEKTQLHQADYHVLPYAENTFDVVWSLESLEHSDDVGSFIREAYRVLKPGGRIVIAATVRGNTVPTLEQVRQMRVGFEAAGAFSDFKTSEEIVTIFDSVGFTDVKNQNETNRVMKSADQMKVMCTLGLPFAKFGNSHGIISDIMVNNTAWGIYQADLLRNDVTRYAVIFGKKE